MKKIILACIILFPLSAMASAYDDMASEIMKKIPVKNRTKAIAVMPFNAPENLSEDSRIAYAEMEKALVEAGAVVTERSQIDKIIREQELQMTGLISDETASEIGKGVGARYMAIGTLAEIDKYGESGNRGLKVSVKLVEISTFKVIAAASGEVAHGDATSKYRRTTVKKAPEYPEFLEIYGGITSYTFIADFDEVLGNGETKLDEKMDTGYALGMRYIHSNSGFLTSAWDFNYTNQNLSSTDDSIQTFQLSWIPIIRLPLWTYADSLPDYTNLYIGYSLGLGINRVEYEDMGTMKSSKGFGFCSSVIAGFKLGLTESVAIFTEARYTPSFLNRYWRSQDINGEDTLSDEYLKGAACYFGLSFAP